MPDTVFVGKNDQILKVPQSLWVKHLEDVPEHAQHRLAFMTPDHHRVRYFVVRELPQKGVPLEPAFIADKLGLHLQRTLEILNELERNLFFLVRNPEGAISWAFPVTAEITPHRVTFDSGEKIYAA